MLLNRTNLYAEFFEDEYTGSHLTEYQIKVIFGETDEDYHVSEEDKIYARIYQEYVEEDTQEYHYFYSLSGNYVLEKEHKRCVQKLDVEELNELQLKERFSLHWTVVRKKRNELLLESDFQSLIYLPDVWENKSQEFKETWLSYRQSLRDITNSTENPYEVIWPEKPEETA
jgi:hypothetical protein